MSSRQQPQNVNYSLCLCLQCNKYFLQAENIHCIQNGCSCVVLQAHYCGFNIMYFDIYYHVLHFDAGYKDDGWALYCVIRAEFCCQIWDMFETRLIHIFLTTQGCRRQSQERLNHVLFYYVASKYNDQCWALWHRINLHISSHARCNE